MTYVPSGSVVVGPVSQPSTPTFVPVAGTIIDLAQTISGTAIYVVTETGGVNGITFKVQGSVDGITCFDIPTYTMSLNGQSGNTPYTTQTLGAGSTLVVIQDWNPETNAPLASWLGRYLQIAIEDITSGSHGVAQVNGFAH